MPKQQTDASLTKTRVRIWRVVEITLGAVSTLSFIFAVGLSYQYVNTRPTSSDASIGRMYRHEIHGQVSYLTATENRNLTSLYWIAAVAFGGMIALELAVRSKR